MKSWRPFFSCTLHALIADIVFLGAAALTILVLVVVVTEGGGCSCSDDEEEEDTTGRLRSMSPTRFMGAGVCGAFFVSWRQNKCRFRILPPLNIVGNAPRTNE